MTHVELGSPPTLLSASLTCGVRLGACEPTRRGGGVSDAQKYSRFGSPLTDTFDVLETGRLTHALLSLLVHFRSPPLQPLLTPNRSLCASHSFAGWRRSSTHTGTRSPCRWSSWCRTCATPSRVTRSTVACGRSVSRSSSRAGENLPSPLPSLTPPPSCVRTQRALRRGACFEPPPAAAMQLPSLSWRQLVA